MSPLRVKWLGALPLSYVDVVKGSHRPSLPSQVVYRPQSLPGLYHHGFKWKLLCSDVTHSGDITAERAVVGIYRGGVMVRFSPSRRHVRAQTCAQARAS